MTTIRLRDVVEAIETRCEVGEDRRREDLRAPGRRSDPHPHRRAGSRRALTAETHGAPRWVWAAVVAVYVLSFPYHPGLRSPNELCRLMQARAIVEFGDLDLNRAMQVYGSVGDLAVYRGALLPVEGAADVLRRGARLRRASSDSRRNGRGPYRSWRSSISAGSF